MGQKIVINIKLKQKDGTQDWGLKKQKCEGVFDTKIKNKIKFTLKTDDITMTGTSVTSASGSDSSLARNSLQTLALADLRKIPTVKGPFSNSTLSIFCVWRKIINKFNLIRFDQHSKRKKFKINSMDTLCHWFIIAIKFNGKIKTQIKTV